MRKIHFSYIVTARNMEQMFMKIDFIGILELEVRVKVVFFHLPLNSIQIRELFS